MALTPEEVVSKTFQPTKFREGYDQDEVDDFLDDVVNTLRALHAENDELKAKLAACESRVGELSRAGAAATSAPSVDKASQPEEPERDTEREAVPAAAEGQPPQVAAAGAGGGNGSVGPEAATGMLALAQRLHDEHVRSGEQQRDQLITDAQTQAEELVREAEERKAQTLGALEQERSLLERKIDELRIFERDYRTRMKAYLEGQLKDLEARGTMVPAGSGDTGHQLGGQS